MHRRLAVPMLPLRVWVHCPRASNGLLPPRSYLVGYVRWDARSDSSSSFRQSFSAAFQVALRPADYPATMRNRYRTGPSNDTGLIKMSSVPFETNRPVQLLSNTRISSFR